MIEHSFFYTAYVKRPVGISKEHLDAGKDTVKWVQPRVKKEPFSAGSWPAATPFVGLAATRHVSTSTGRHRQVLDACGSLYVLGQPLLGQPTGARSTWLTQQSSAVFPAQQSSCC